MSRLPKKIATAMGNNIKFFYNFLFCFIYFSVSNYKKKAKIKKCYIYINVILKNCFLRILF